MTQAALLFVDICGSTQLYARLGEAEAGHAVDRCLKRIERIVEGFQGRVLQSGGDEMLIGFEGLETACQAAMEMQERVADLPPVSGLRLAIRIGIHVDADSTSVNATETAARIVGCARGEQILISRQAASLVSARVESTLRPPAAPPEGADGAGLLEVVWRAHSEAASPPPVPEAPPTAPVPAKLCMRYRGRAFLLDDKNPILTLGRDSGSDIVIEDRRASRLHGRIERRDGTYFYVDRSTNGSYVKAAGLPETLLRHGEIRLEGKGSICFGASINDPNAECAQFELL